MTNAETGDIGNQGSLERGLSGDYEIVIGDILKEALRKTSGVRVTYFLALLLYVATTVLLSLGLNFLTELFGFMALPLVGLATQILTTGLVSPMLAGVWLIGMRRSMNAPTRASMVLSYFHLLVPLFVQVLIFYIMISAGFALLILPGIYLSVAYFLATPLLIDKGLSPWAALEASRKAITHQWCLVIGLLIILMLINFAATIPFIIMTLFGLHYAIGLLLTFGIWFLWTVPLSFLAFGVLYRTVFGLEPKTLAD